MGRRKSWDPNLDSWFAEVLRLLLSSMPPSADFQSIHEQQGVLSQLKRKGVLRGEMEGTVQVNVRWEPAPPPGLYSPFSIYTY